MRTLDNTPSKVVLSRNIRSIRDAYDEYMKGVNGGLSIKTVLAGPDPKAVQKWRQANE